MIVSSLNNCFSFPHTHTEYLTAVRAKVGQVVCSCYERMQEREIINNYKMKKKEGGREREKERERERANK